MDKLPVNKSVKKRYLPIPLKCGEVTWYAYGPILCTEYHINGTVHISESWPKEYTEIING